MIQNLNGNNYGQQIIINVNFQFPEQPEEKLQVKPKKKKGKIGVWVRFWITVLLMLIPLIAR